MMFTEAHLTGVFVIEPEKLEDLRGFFARTWCQREFDLRGLNPRLVQCSTSFNKKSGTLRGMHYQVAPHAETKLVRCTSGSIHDTVIDLRPGSATFLKHFSIMLTDQNRTMLYVPEGCAHGFQTLEDDTEVFYQMSEFYCPNCSRGVRWNDPAFGLKWPDATRIMSERDWSFPDFQAHQTVSETFCCECVQGQ